MDRSITLFLQIALESATLFIPNTFKTGDRVGSFYCNVTVLGRAIEAVQDVTPRPAFLLSGGDAVLVFAELDDDGAPFTGQQLSAELSCLTFSAGVHDDDIFFFEIHDRGQSVAQGAVPDPSAFFGDDADVMAELDPSMMDGMDVDSAEASGNGVVDPAVIVGLIGQGDVQALREALESDFVFATERHGAVTAALGLPSAAVGWGYRYLLSGDGYTGPPLTQLS